MRPLSFRFGAALGAAALLAAASLPGQWGYMQRQRSSSSENQQSRWMPPPEWASPMAPQSMSTPVPPPYRPGFQGLKSTTPMYSAFPSYPKGFGPPPRVGGFLPEETRDPTMAEWSAPALPRDDRGRWPSWIETGVPNLEKSSAPERAALVRMADRVWFLAPDDTAFVPIPFYDKFRIVDSGTFVEVRNKGEFQMVFHDGAWLRSIGATSLGVPVMSSSIAELQLTAFRRLWLHAKDRTMHVLLPDGSKLELAGTKLYLEREGQRGMVFNNGPRAMRWIGRVGEREIPPAHRIEIFLEGTTAPYLAAALQLQGAVRAEPEGRDVMVRGEAGGGAVTWSGALIKVRGGTSVHLDPLAGKGFPETNR